MTGMYLRFCSLIERLRMKIIVNHRRVRQTLVTKQQQRSKRTIVRARNLQNGL